MTFRLGYSPSKYRSIVNEKEKEESKAPLRAIAGISVREWKRISQCNTLLQWLVKSKEEYLGMEEKEEDIVNTTQAIGIVKAFATNPSFPLSSLSSPPTQLLSFDRFQ
jgi:hypothetical protein